MSKDMDKREAVLVEEQTKYRGNDYKTLKELVKYIIQCREDGNNMYIYFRGHRLYSADTTEKSAFLDVFGTTYEMIDKTFKACEGATPKDKETLKQLLMNKKSEYRAKQREGAKEIKIPFYTVEDVVEYLQDKKRDGENVYVKYKGCILYSCDVTVNSAKKAIEKAAEKEEEEDKDVPIYIPGVTKIKPVKGAVKIEEETEEPEL